VRQSGSARQHIKPSNLILVPSEGISGAGLVKVLDIGLAKILMDEGQYTFGTPSGFGMGTYGYMAPEQEVDARSVGIQADIFSLGRTLYYLLSGVVPSQQHVVPLAQIRSDLSIEVHQLIEGMTVEGADGRFPSCGDVLRALAPLCEPIEKRTNALLDLLRPIRTLFKT
jgi:serine/threonine-protein kinase